MHSFPDFIYVLNVFKKKKKRNCTLYSNNSINIKFLNAAKFNQILDKLGIKNN